MKELIYIFFASVFILTACQKEEDPLFDKTPTERVDAAILEYKKKLTSKEHWVAYYEGHAILMKFNEDNTVVISSTFRHGQYDQTVTYRVGVSQVVELTFESYTIWHAIYQNARSTREYEFLFDKIEDEAIEFVSKTDTDAEPTRVKFISSDEATLEQAKKVYTDIAKMSYFSQITVAGDKPYVGQLSFMSEGRVIVKESFDNNFNSSDYKYFPTKEGLRLEPALKIGDVEGYSNFVYSKEENAFVSTKEPIVKIESKGTPAFSLNRYSWEDQDDLRFNSYEHQKSSLYFDDYFKDYKQEMETKGLNVNSFGIQFYMGDAYFYISTSTHGFRWYLIGEPKISEDGTEVIFPFAGSSNVTQELHQLFEPLWSIIFDEKGFYIEHTGSLQQYINQTFILINRSNPNVAINFFDIKWND